VDGRPSWKGDLGGAGRAFGWYVCIGFGNEIHGKGWGVGWDSNTYRID